MNILYISTANSNKKYNILFEKSKGELHHSIQKFHQLIINGLKENNNDITVLSGLQISNKTVNKKIFLSETEKENEISYLYPFFINITVLKQIFTVISFIWYFIIWNIKNKSDKRVIIDSAYVSVAPIMVFLCRIFNIKCTCIVADIYNYMTLDINIKQKRTFFEKISCKICNYCWHNYDYFILLTEEMNKVINPLNKPHIVIEGLVDNDIELNNKKLKKEKAIMYAGGLTERYGVKILIDAFNEWDNKDYELWLCGHGDLEGYINKLNNKKIKYFGNIINSDVLKLEKKASLLVNPRLTSEEYTKYSFPSKNMEYMLSGTPLLTTKLQGMPEEYKDYVYLIEEESKDGIIQKLEEIFSNNEKKLKEKGKSAQTFVIENKNKVVQTKKIIKLIQDKSEETRKENKKQKITIKDIYGFLLLFVFIYFSRNTLFSSFVLGANISFIIQILFSIPLIYLQFKKIIKNKKISLEIVVLLMSIILSIIIKQDFQLYNFSILAYIIIAYFYIKEFDNKKILKYFSIIMIFLSIYSLIATYFVKVNIINNFTNIECEKYNFCFKNSYNLYFLNLIFAFPIYILGYIRNFGIFTEPAYYQFYLFILLIILLFKKDIFKYKLIKNFSILVCVITILTTFSTAAYLIIPFLLIGYLFEIIVTNKVKRKKIIYNAIIIFLLIIVLTIIIINKNNNIKNMMKMIILKLTQSNDSANTRFGSLFGNFKQFILSPIIGNNFIDVLKYNSTTTNFSFLALYGIIPGLIMFKLQYLFTTLFSKNNLVKAIIFICILLSCNNHFFNGCISYWVIILMGLTQINQYKKKEKRNENIMDD